jgi:predicted aconitase with swiveling domain
LRVAGLIAGGGKDDSKPTNAYDGHIGVHNQSIGLSSHVTIFGQIEGSIGKVIDSREDDGNSLTGRIQAGMLSSSMAVNLNSKATGSITYANSECYSIAFRL